MAQVNNLSEAIGVLIQGCNVGQKAGAYSLDDVRLIIEAMDYIKEHSQKDDNKILSMKGDNNGLEG